jgi:polyhydroxybutyrate depolymerase
MRNLVFAALAVLSLAACSSPATEPVDGVHTIRSGGVERSYIVSSPADLDKPAPLVLVLHGGFGSAEQAQDAYGWDELAASEGFVVAYPDGLGKAWNAGDGCCGASGKSGVDDVAFIEEVARSIARSTEIDPDRIFVTGMSNGAMMSYRLACDTDIFAAIAPVAGTLLGACDDPAPTSVLHIHGLADDSVHVDGSPGNGPVTIDGMPIAELNELWRSIDGCDEPTVTEAPPVTTTTAGCGDRDVTLLTVDGAGHQWPGSTRSRAQVRMGTDKPSDALDATTVIWKFFEAHPKG